MPVIAADDSPFQNQTVAFWPLNEGQGQHIRNQNADDFHGAVTKKGFTWKKSVASFPGDKVGGHIRIPDGGKLLAGPAFEISLDVRPTSANSVGPLLGTKSVSESRGGFNLHYWLKGKRLSFNFADGTQVYHFRFKCRLPVNQWSSLIVRYDGTDVVAFVNGKEIGRHSQPGQILKNNPRAPLLIGGYMSSTDCWKGQLRNIRLKHLATAKGSQVVRVKTSPKIDGIMNDAIWKKTGFHPSVSDPKTSYALCADDTHLYIAARCSITRTKRNKNTPLVISLDPEITGHRYFQIELTPGNKVSTALVGYYGRLVQDDFTISKLATATKVQATRWTAEIAIPFASLAVPEKNQPYWRLDLRQMKSVSNRKRQMRIISNLPAPRYSVKQKRRIGSLIYQWKLNDPAPLDLDLKFRPPHNTWFVANNLVVPNWFNIDLPAKSIRDFDAHLILDLPNGIELLHVGTLKADSSVKTKLRKSRFTWKKENKGRPIIHQGKPYTRYRIDVAEIHQRLHTIGPFYLRSSQPNETVQTLYYQTVYPNSKHPVEQLKLISKTFPTPGPPKKLLASLTWMSPEDYMNWPDGLNSYSQLGFNAFSIQKRDRNLLPQGAKTFLDRARQQGMKIVAVDSAFHSLLSQPDAHSILASGRTAHDVCPAYRGHAYQKELQSIALWSAELQADYLVLDVECFQKGSDYGISKSCSRCADYITKTKLSPRMSMISLGTAIQKDVHKSVKKVHQQRRITPPNIGFYHSKPGGFVYQNTLCFDKSYPQFVGHAEPVFYNTQKDSTGSEIRRMRRLIDHGDLIPWFTTGFHVAGGRPIEYPSEWVYDRVLEGYGNGIRGINWFTFKNFEAADFYYYAKAIESIKQVDNLIYDSQPLDNVAINKPYKVTAIKHLKTKSILLLISEYTKGASGKVVVTLPVSIAQGSQLYDLARHKKIKTISGRRMTFTFNPGVKGAHTSLFLIK